MDILTRQEILDYLGEMKKINEDLGEAIYRVEKINPTGRFENEVKEILRKIVKSRHLTDKMLRSLLVYVFYMLK